MELGVIRVVTQGNRDAVYLIRADEQPMLALVVTCRPGQGSHVWLNLPKLRSCPDGVWRQISDAYLVWKRASNPDFALPTPYGHAHTKAGKPHPWSYVRRAKRPLPPPDIEDD